MNSTLGRLTFIGTSLACSTVLTGGVVIADEGRESGVSAPKTFEKSGWLAFLVGKSTQEPPPINRGKDANTSNTSGSVYVWGGIYGRRPVHLSELGEDVTKVAVTNSGTGITLNCAGRVNTFTYDAVSRQVSQINTLGLRSKAVDIALCSEREEVVIVDDMGELYKTKLHPIIFSKDHVKHGRDESADLLKRDRDNQEESKTIDQISMVNTDGDRVCKKVRSVKCGSRHCVAITQCGRVFAWGANDMGQLGNPDYQFHRNDKTRASKDLKDNKNECVKSTIAGEMLCPSEMSAVVDAACGDNHTLVVDDSGSVFGCGSDYWTQLATTAHPWLPDHQKRHDTLVKASLLHPLTTGSVAAGGNHSAFLMRDGNLFTSGFNQFGQLAHHNYSSFAPPSPVADFSLRMKQIAAGGNITCVITEKNEVRCIGANAAGQLGVGSLQPSATWRKPRFGAKVRMKPVYIYVNNENAAMVGTKQVPVR